MISTKKILTKGNGFATYACSYLCSANEPLSLLEVLLLHAIEKKIDFTRITPQKKLTTIFESFIEKIQPSGVGLCSLVTTAFATYQSIFPINTISAIALQQ